MNSPLSIIAVLTVVVFLGGAASGMLVLFVISIHRTYHAPLSRIPDQRAGSISRRVLLTAMRHADKDDDQ